MSNKFDLLFDNQLSNHLKKSQIENRDEIISLISTSFPWTSTIDHFFANQILFESITLIKNSILQFEEGFFDAAIYSLAKTIKRLFFKHINNRYLINQGMIYEKEQNKKL